MCVCEGVVERKTSGITARRIGGSFRGIEGTMRREFQTAEMRWG